MRSKPLEGLVGSATKVWQQARRAQIAVMSRIFLSGKRLKSSAALYRFLRGSSTLERALVGHRRTFATRAEAEREALALDTLGHQHPANIRQHMSFGEQARPSDYAAMFYIERMLPEVRHIVDLGGSTGNIFYCYQHYLPFAVDLRWTVVDLPAQVEAGRALAESRNEQRLEFVSDLDSVAGADLVLISGALQFFDKTPLELLAGWPALPKFILINRSPVKSHGEIYGIQDQGLWVTTARVIDRPELLGAMTGAGYQLVDEWEVAELSMWFPMDPDRSVKAYSGFLFELDPDLRKA